MKKQWAKALRKNQRNKKFWHLAPATLPNSATTKITNCLRFLLFDDVEMKRTKIEQLNF